MEGEGGRRQGEGLRLGTVTQVAGQEGRSRCWWQQRRRRGREERRGEGLAGGSGEEGVELAVGLFNLCRAVRWL